MPLSCDFQGKVSLTWDVFCAGGVTDADAQLDALRAQLWDVRTELAAAAAAAEAGAAAAAAAVAGAREEAAAAAKRADVALTERQAAQRGAEDAVSASEALRAELDAARADLDVARALPAEEVVRAPPEGDVSELRQELAGARVRAEELATQLCERDARVSELELRSAAGGEALGERLASAEAEAARLRQSLAASEAAALAYQGEHARQLAASAVDRAAAAAAAAQGSDGVQEELGRLAESHQRSMVQAKVREVRIIPSLSCKVNTICR